MKLTIKNSLLYFILPFFLFQCGQSEPVSEEEGHAEETHAGHGEHEEEGEEGVVELSEVQLASIDLEYGSLDSANFSGFVKANGILDLPPQNIAAVSAPVAGFVKKANYLVGDHVEKGAVLAILEHLDYVKPQEEYLNTLSNLVYLEAEYERQRQLDSAEVTSKKQFQAARAALKSAQARKKALEKQLVYMGLSPEQVAQGSISSTIAIKAPFSGFITQLNVHNGEFAKPEQELYELVDTDHMHLELNVFEQDLTKIKIGQPIRFTVPSVGPETYQGEVFLVGKSFDQETKSVKVHGHIEGEHPTFIRGMYTEAKIYTGNEVVQVLPEEAIVEEEGKSYIFIRTEDAHGHEEENHEAAVEEPAREGADEHANEEEHGVSFRMIQIVPGKKDQGFVEVKQISDLAEDAEIVTQGAYYLFSEMKKGEGGHHHH